MFEWPFRLKMLGKRPFSTLIRAICGKNLQAGLLEYGRWKRRDLKQFNREYFASLSPEQLLNFAENMLNDLRDARDQQNQTPQNSSRLSGSYAPWEQAPKPDTRGQSEDTDSNEDA